MSAIAQLRRLIPAIRQSEKDYTALIMLADKVFKALTGNPTFPTPSPTLASLDTANDALRVSAPKMLRPQNRPSKVDADTARADAKKVRELLLQLLDYVMNVILANYDDTQQQQTIFNTTGFTAGNVFSKTKKTLQPVKFVQQTKNKEFNLADHRITWKRPLGLIKGKKVLGYKLFKIVGANRTFLATTTVTNYQASEAMTVQVVPFSNNGDGRAFEVTIR